MKKVLLIILSIFLLAACGLSPEEIALQTHSAATATAASWTKTPTPTHTSTSTPTPKPTLTSTPHSSCNPNEVIESIKDVISYDYFTLSYNIFNDVHYIYFWIVDSDLNPSAGETELTTNVDLAISHAIELAYELNKADDCVADLFDAFNPVVVDRNYNGWFSGVINIKDLPTTGEISENDIETIERLMPTEHIWKRTTIPDIQNIPPDACTWNEVRENVARHFAPVTLNSYILVADNNGITFTVQYLARDKVDEIVVFLNTGREVECLKPPVNYILVVLVDENGYVFSVENFPLD